MKNVIRNTKKGILMVTMMATLASFANNKFDFELRGNIAKTALVVKDVKAGDLLTIKDFTGRILYKESIEIAGVYKKGFNLTALPDGDYFFEVDKAIEITTIPFTLKNNSISYKRGEETSVYKPFVKHSNDMVFITKVAPKSEPLKISIYSNFNGDSTLLYSELVENTRAIEKAYKLEKGGKYKITLSSDNRTYTEFINN